MSRLHLGNKPPPSPVLLSPIAFVFSRQWRSPLSLLSLCPRSSDQENKYLVDTDGGCYLAQGPCFCWKYKAPRKRYFGLMSSREILRTPGSLAWCDWNVSLGRDDDQEFKKKVLKHEYHFKSISDVLSSFSITCTQESLFWNCDLTKKKIIFTFRWCAEICWHYVSIHIFIYILLSL